MLQIKNLNKNSKIAILGFWKEWKSSLWFLKKNAFTDITILDESSSIDDTTTPQILGEWYLDNLDTFGLIIKSPGVSPYHPKLTAHREKIISQTQIFFEYYCWKVIGITGTKWKSTVSSLTYSTLKEFWYKVKLVWNIGTPVLDEIDLSQTQKYDYIIYEMSSYMLEWFSPDLYIGYVNNIFPCHLDWHTSMEYYKQAKYNILRNSQISITHSSLEWGAYTFPDTNNFHYTDKYFYRWSTQLFSDQKIQLLWEHNRINICGVLTILSHIVDVSSEQIESFQELCESFSPLSHRLENIWIYRWISFIDDGVAVTPEATIAGIWSVQNIQTLLVGGKEIWMDQSKLEEAIIISSIQNIVVFPETGYSLFDQKLQEEKEGLVFDFDIWWRTIKVLKTRSMQEAVKFSYAYTQPWYCVLLSSAAQSYSLWKNYEEKWNEFKKYVKQYAKI